MPFQSKKQARFMFAAEKRGDVPEGTAKKWAGETNFEDLPEKKKPKRYARGGEVMKCPACGTHLAFAGGEVGDDDDDDEDEQEKGMSQFAGAIRARKKKNSYGF